MAPQRPTLGITGVSQLSDLYPNVRYRVVQLRELADVSEHIHDLGSGSLYARSTGAGRLRLALQMAWGHLRVFWRILLRPGDQLYVVYPAVFLVAAFSLLPARRRPRILMDAFISLYDTLVNDRGLLEAGAWRARLLYRLERRAFTTAAVVIVDTRENAGYYSELFRLPASRFVAVPLAIPPLEAPAEPVPQTREDAFTCLFMGSMVPLQGIETLLAAIALLADDPRIRFVFIGDGQQSPLLEEFLHTHPHARLCWHRRLLSTPELITEITRADLCLGIFGTTAKANRVLPFKLYYYAALGKPFLSGASSCLRRLADPALTCPVDAGAGGAHQPPESRQPGAGRLRRGSADTP